MNVFTKSKRIIKSAAITGTTLALVAVPTAALAHGGGHDDSNKDSGRRTAAAQQAQQKDKHNNSRSNDWSNRNKNRQKLTCDQRQEALNQRAADAKTKYTKKLNGLNIVYTGVQTYVSSGDVTVENYDAMNAQVAADQTAATNAVNAITPTQLNCADPNAAAAASDDNKTYHDHEKSSNDSVDAARQAIKTYKNDLNTLFEAVINS